VNTDSREHVNQSPNEGEKPYPHRISFDMATPQYKRLKWASFDSDRTMNEILREAVEDWMKARDY
jgi:predicted DNA-binding protein